MNHWSEFERFSGLSIRPCCLAACGVLCTLGQASATSDPIRILSNSKCKGSLMQYEAFQREEMATKPWLQPCL